MGGGWWSEACGAVAQRRLSAPARRCWSGFERHAARMPPTAASLHWNPCASTRKPGAAPCARCPAGSTPARPLRAVLPPGQCTTTTLGLTTPTPGRPRNYQGRPPGTPASAMFSTSLVRMRSAWRRSRRKLVCSSTPGMPKVEPWSVGFAGAQADRKASVWSNNRTVGPRTTQERQQQRPKGERCRRNAPSYCVVPPLLSPPATPCRPPACHN